MENVCYSLKKIVYIGGQGITFRFGKNFWPHYLVADTPTGNTGWNRMKLHRLERIQNLPISRNEAWRFFSQPLNLPEITPEWLGFRLNNAVPDRMFAGMVISYRIKPLFGIPATWISEINHVHEPEYFIDEQRFGPYRFWHHRHRFKPIDDGTQLCDIVHYAIGFGKLGNWIQRLMVAPRLDNIFNYREEKLKHLFFANTCEQKRRIH